MTDTSPDGLDKVRSDFIEKVGLIAQTEGMPRIAGRIFALLLFDGETISFGEIAERLQVSRGSVSSTTRLLEDRGLIKRVGKPGQRQDFFRLADNPYQNMLDAVVTGLDRARGEIGETLQHVPEDRADIRDRVQTYERFYKEMGRAIGQSIENLK